jgi:hypothetical protein
MAAGPSTKPLSVRVHFWLRMAGVVVILAAQFGPRVVGSVGASLVSSVGDPPPRAATGIALVAH